MKLREIISRYGLIFPGALFVIIFLLIPVALVMAFSFYTLISPGNYLPHFTLENWTSLLTKSQHIRIILNTLSLSTILAVVSIILAFPAAYFLAFKITNQRLQTMVLLLLIIPYWIDWTIRTMSWFPILGSEGFVNYTFMSLGLIQEPIKELLFTKYTLILVWFQSYILFMITPIYFALIKIDREFINAARVLRAPPSKVFYHIIFKLSLPGVVVGVVFIFVSTMADYITPALWGGGIQTAGLTINSLFINNVWPMAASYSGLLIIVISIVCALLLKVVDIKRIF